MTSRRKSALAGIAGGAIAVAVAEFLAALTSSVSPLEAVGSLVIDVSPTAVREWAIDWFGTADKAVLRGGTIVVMVLLAAVAGVRGRRRPTTYASVLAAAAALGIVAAIDRPSPAAGAVVGILVGLVAGSFAGIRLLPVAEGPTEYPRESRAPLEGDRRQFVGWVTAAATAAVAGGLAAAMRRRDESQAAELAAGPLPTATEVDRLPPLPEGVEIHPSAPFVTPAGEFYRIDTALSLPRADPATWTLTIDGLVDRPQRLSYADLQAMPQVERVITLCCVSNEIGGRYVGNAVWQGVPLADLLEAAGVSDSAEQVFSTSIDGWTCGFPVETALDGRDAMVALTMNGEPLPRAHGFPARLVVPGLYGYVSATKWLERIELTTWEREGYWVPRGWSRLGPVKTQSRIDVPRRDQRLQPGPQPIAGVAWAQHRGISAVEVSIDEGPWQPARLGTDVSADTWRQWVLEWDATTGDHRIRVRATDGEGQVQVEERTSVAPDGATGWHTIDVSVA